MLYATRTVAKQPEVNLALNKGTWQRDRYGNSDSRLAVDGNFDPDWSGNSIAMTNVHEMPWWAVDLEKSYQVDRVVVTNRNDVRKYPDSKVHGANMGPIWGRQDPGGPHVGPMNFAIWVGLSKSKVV